MGMESGLRPASAQLDSRQRRFSGETGPGQKYAVQARRWVAAPRAARPDVCIEIRRCPAHRGVVGDEKADEWAELAVQKPGAHGVERLGFGNRYRGRPVSLPRSRANIKREISEEEWAEARRWAEGRIATKKYGMPTKQRPNTMVAACHPGRTQGGAGRARRRPRARTRGGETERSRTTETSRERKRSRGRGAGFPSSCPSFRSFLCLSYVLRSGNRPGQAGTGVTTARGHDGR